MWHLKVLFVFVTFLQVFGDTEGSKDDAPLLEPDHREQIITAGNNLSIKCIGKKPIKWELPSNSVRTKDLFEISYGFENEADYPYVTNLQVPDLQYLDVGFYICKYADSVTENNTLEYLTAEGHATSVYIYVEGDKLMVSNDEAMSVGSATTEDDFVIPCRPTSPDVRVTLVKNGVEISEYDTPRLSFDPKIGFGITASRVLDSAMYTCQFYRNNKTEEKMYFINVSRRTDFIAKPQIKEYGTGYVEEGDTLMLNCSVSVGRGILFNLEWKQIPSNEPISERVQVDTDDNVQHSKHHVTKTLTIHDVSSKDEGEYLCMASDNSGNTNKHKKFIKVFTKNTSFINLSTPNNRTDIKIDANSGLVQWKIIIDAHPKADVFVFLKDGTEVTNSRDPDAKYYVETTMKDILFKINKIDYRDSGIYVVKAMNRLEEKVLNLTLIVNEKPTVRIADPSTTYIINKTVDIDCYVSGHPEPVIKWFFEDCSAYPNCEGSENIELEANPVSIEKPFLYKSTLTIAPDKTGNITCKAENKLGNEEYRTPMFVSDVENGFAVWPVNNAAQFVSAIGDDVTIHCGASVYNYSGEISWFKDDNPIAEDEKQGISVTKKNTSYSYQTSIHLKNIDKTEAGQYSCQATKIEDYSLRFPEYFTVVVKDLAPPSIYSRKMNGSDIALSLGEPLIIDCTASGVPPPEITWFKDEYEIRNSTRNNSRIQITTDASGTSELTIDKINLMDDGMYSCEATNKVDKDRRTTKLIIKDKPGLQLKYIIIIACLLVVFFILIIFLIIKIRKERTLRKELAVAGLAHFEEGALESINPDLGVDDQAELLPYDRKWEFPREKLKLGKQLGSGAFGVVLKAEAHGICDEDTTTSVAVKMVKRTADPTFIKALASELKIMVHLGKHLNVVNLLGAVTKNVTKRELLVIVEFCRFGNIHNYLLRHRSEFIDQVDPNTDQIDPTIGSEILNRAYSVSSNRSRIKIGQLFSTSSSGEQRSELLENAACATGDSNNSGYLSPIQLDYHDNGNSAGQTAATDMTMISMTPTGDEPMLSNNSIQPEWRSNYRGDYRGNVRPLLTQDLLCWAFQVARGMEYLASRKVLHGDLAARNILLAEDNIVKICDFGLAKSMYKDDNYKKKGDGPLPVKWMAVESIRDRVFSTQSDVWSFGVVLWELFSLARTPYPGMEANEKLYMKLVDGYRMEKPQFANQAVYQIMMDCWRARPPTRPTFTDLAESLGNMLTEGLKTHYIDLNNPYLIMNNQAVGQSDYLAMMSAPDFEQLNSPQVEEHHYVNSPSQIPAAGGDDSGYLCMSPGNGGTVIFSPRSTTTDTSAFKFPPASNVLSTSPTPSQSKSPDSLAGLNNQPRSRKKLVDAESLSVELTPMLSSNINSDSESEMSPKFNKSASNYQNVNVNDLEKNINSEQPSFSNPSYHNLFGKSWDSKPVSSEIPVSPVISKDNYINMPKQKNAFLNSNVDAKPAAFENPSYVTMIPNLDDTKLSDNESKVEHHYVNG